MTKYELEFILKSSSKILYNHISSASGLSEWFCDDIIIRKDGTHVFVWDGSEEEFVVDAKKRDEFIRFKRVDEDDSFIEFRIKIDPMTNSVALIVSDFCDEDELEEEENLWESQINRLRQKIGG